MLGDHQLEHGIAEKFQPLIVKVECFALEREARMGQGFGEEERIAELVADVPLERVHMGGQLRGSEVGGG